MQNQLCTIHQKELEIICLTDFSRICALCAVFGAHKDHQLKTVDEMTKMLGATAEEFEQLKQTKKSIQSRIKNLEFKSQIVQKMATAKLQLSKKIKDQFTQIRQSINQAQKNANDDLNKRFKQVHDRINKMAKQESEFEGMFSNWARMIELQLAQMGRVDLLYEQKVEIYWQRIMSCMQQGELYLSKIQLYTEEKRSRMQTVPGMVSVVLGENLMKDIYNYVSVKFDESELERVFGEIMLKDYKVEDELLLRMEMEGSFLKGSSTMNGGFGSSQKLGISMNNKPTSNPAILQTTTDFHNNYQTKPIKVQFSSSKNFLSPTKNKIISPPQLRSYNNFRKSPQQKPQSLPKHQPPKGSVTHLNKNVLSPAKKDLISSVSSFHSVGEKRKIQTTIQGIVDSFLQDDKLDTLDLCSFEMPDHEILATLNFVIPQKKIKCLKLSQNKLTNEGFSQIISMLKLATNLNLSHNLLTEQILNTLIKQRQKVPNLRILNLTHNKINQRKAKVYVQELKKQGIIVTF